jgi:hypothetical protein
MTHSFALWRPELRSGQSTPALYDTVPGHPERTLRVLALKGPGFQGPHPTYRQAVAILSLCKASLPRAVAIDASDVRGAPCAAAVETRTGAD